MKEVIEMGIMNSRQKMVLGTWSRATFRRLLRSPGGVGAISGYKQEAPLKPIWLVAIPGYKE
jgi:hypothetical protein